MCKRDLELFFIYNTWAQNKSGFKWECYFLALMTSQMLQMGYDPSKGLGKQQTGIIEQISPTPRNLHTELGYPNL